MSSRNPQKPTHTHTGNLLKAIKQIGTICFAVFTFIFSSFADPDIASSASTADCKYAPLETYSGTSNLQANWDANTIDLHWYNGDTELTVPSASQSCTYDGTLTPPATIPTKTGYTFAGWKVREVPYGYTWVSGIRNTASASSSRINTGIVDDVDDMEYELRVKPSTGSWYLFQSRQGTSGDIYGFGGSSSGATINASCGSPTVSLSMTRNNAHIYYLKYTHKNGSSTLYIKDETTGTEETKTKTYTNYTPAPNNICLFGNMAGQYVGVGNVIYMARLKKNGELVRDYIPVVSSNNEIGFWERVGKSFIKSSSFAAVQ